MKEWGPKPGCALPRRCLERKIAAAKELAGCIVLLLWMLKSNSGQEGMNMTIESLNQQVHIHKGKDGWPSDLTFKASEGDNIVEVTVGDARSAKDGVWKRIGPWVFAFFDKAKEITKNALIEKPARLTFSLRSPDTPLAKCQYEALKRRVSYLAEANHLQITLLKGDADDELYTFEKLTNRPDTEIVHHDFRDQGVDDKTHGLEKDFQKYLAGWGLPKKSDFRLTNERLALFGDDFVRINKVKSGVVKEFPTGAFKDEVTRSNTLLSTEFVDLVTLNKHGDLAVIEIKFDDANLEVISQVLNYALFFHSYRTQLTHLLDEKLACATAGRKLVTYLVSNTFHNKFKSVWPYYSQHGPNPQLDIRQVIMGQMPDTENTDAA